MDIFRSKEIYRKIRKREEGQDKDPLVAIRGLYVVGDHMYPVYDNACIRINEIKTKHPRIVDYTSRIEDKEIDNSIVGTIGMSIGGELTVTRYTRNSVNLHDDSIVGVIGMSINEGIDLLRYTRKTEQVDGSIVGTLGMSIGGDLTLEPYYRKPLLCQPEPMLMITAVNRTQCTITDGDVTY